MLDRLESIQAELEADRDDKTAQRRLQHENYVLRREFAKHLTIEVTRHSDWNGEYKTKGFYESNDGKVVRATRRADGQPSKAGKVAAAAWMASRNVSWNGSAPELRREVMKALGNGELVPKGYFGLHVDLTVEIETREWLMQEGGGKWQMVPGGTRYS
jgi:hypothetical protein